MEWRRGRPNSQDLRERALALVDDGMAAYAVAALLRVSVSWIYKALARRRTSGETSARRQCNHVKPKLAELHDAIRAEIMVRPDVTLAELRDWLVAEHRVSVSLGVLCTTLAKLDLARKKRRYAPPSRTAPMWPRHASPGAPVRPLWTRPS